MPTFHPNSMATRHNHKGQYWTSIASNIDVSENPIYRFLGLNGLPVREKTVATSSSTTSSSTTSSSIISSSTTSSLTTFLPLPPFPPLPPLLPLPPLPPLPSLLSLSPRCYCCGEASGGACGEACGGARHCCGAGLPLPCCCCCGGVSVSGISGPGVGGAVAFFLTGLLPLFVSSKISRLSFMVFHCTIGPRCSVTSYSDRYVVKSKTMPIFWCCAGLIGLKIGHYQVSGTSGYIRIDFF